MPEVIAKAKDTEGKSMEDARKDHLDRWWQFWNVRHDMREAMSNCERYIACSQVTKRPIFCFLDPAITPDATLQIWTFDDDYSFGVIHSVAHWEWFFAKCSKLKSDFRFTRRSVWDTFPWPQGPNFTGPTPKQIVAIAEAGRKVRAVRDEALTKIKGGLRAVYRTLELPGKNPLKDAHAALDKAVLDAYGFSKRKDLLQQLLDLNRTIAARETDGEPVAAPGILASYTGDRDALITDDCIRP